MSDDVLHLVAPSGRVLAYGGDPSQLIEVFATDGEPAAVVAFIHGGFWRHAYDRAHARPLANALVELGYAVALVEYRRTPDPDDPDSGGTGGWPGTFDDVKRAVTVLRHDTAPETPLILAGHSAGGHLALWAATTSDRFAGVVALAPVTDLVACDTNDIGGDAVRLLLGGSTADHGNRYASVDPIRLPVPHDTTVVHGTDDTDVPIAMSRTYATVTGAHLVELRDTGHYELIDPRTQQWTSVVDAIADVTARYRARTA